MAASTTEVTRLRDALRARLSTLVGVLVSVLTARSWADDLAGVAEAEFSVRITAIETANAAAVQEQRTRAERAEADRDTARAERDAARAERDAARADLAACNTARTQAVQQRDTAAVERDAALVTRDTATAHAHNVDRDFLRLAAEWEQMMAGDDTVVWHVFGERSLGVPLIVARIREVVRAHGGNDD